MNNSQSRPAYILGHSEFEQQRLARQERLVGDITVEYFVRAGISPGMKVLDVGSGTGPVALHAAKLVGPSGRVVGTDLSSEALATAREMARNLGLDHVTFLEGDPTAMRFAEKFDAIVGRYVLLFQADPADMLRRLALCLKPGGIVCFHEPDWSYARSSPTAPLYDRCIRWIVEAFDRVGTSTNMGARLHHAFIQAGFRSPTMGMNALIGDATSRPEFLVATAELVMVLAPSIVGHGIATSEEIGADTLIDRLARDVAANRSLIVGRAEIVAWTNI